MASRRADRNSFRKSVVTIRRGSRRRAATTATATRGRSRPPAAPPPSFTSIPSPGAGQPGHVPVPELERRRVHKVVPGTRCPRCSASADSVPGSGNSASRTRPGGWRPARSARVDSAAPWSPRRPRRARRSGAVRRCRRHATGPAARRRQPASSGGLKSHREYRRSPVAIGTPLHATTDASASPCVSGSTGSSTNSGCTSSSIRSKPPRHRG